MTVARKKRRLVRWMRYLQATESQSTNRLFGGIHTGHSKAYMRYMYAARPAPIGIRVPWGPLSQSGRP